MPRADERISRDIRAESWKKGLLYGATISAATINNDPEFVELGLRHVGVVVAENDVK